MPLAIGYAQLQPTYVLGTNQWASAVAEQMVGADIDRANQLRDHLPFFSLARSNTIVVPRVASLATAGFLDAANPQTNSSVSALVDPPETIELATIEGTIDLSTYPIAVQSFSVDQLSLQIELKKIAIRVSFWNQFFRKKQPNGFKGLPDLVSARQVLASAGALSLDRLDELVAAVTEANGEMDRKVLVMNHLAFRQFVRSVRATGATLSQVTYNGRRYAAHNGVPVVISDYVPVEPAGDTGATAIWCMTLGLEDNGMFGVVPEGVGDNGLVVEVVQGARDVASVVHRARWYCAVLLGHERGLAVLHDVKVPLS